MASKDEYEYVGDDGFSPEYGMLTKGRSLYLTPEEADKFGPRVAKSDADVVVFKDSIKTEVTK